jgi:DNA invertase Pin-like site-specific DNA recombinase
MTTYGYARVSSDGQSLAGQMASLKEAGCTTKTIFAEKESGAGTKHRKALAKVMKVLESGDVLVITRLDRLARSTRDLLNILHDIAERGAGFKSLHEPAIDTTTSYGRLVTSILGSIAEFERELIRTRTGEGRARAKARGARFGRPLTLTPHQWQEARKRYDNGESQRDIAKSFNVNQSTIHRLLSGEIIAAGK